MNVEDLARARIRSETAAGVIAVRDGLAGAPELVIVAVLDGRVFIRHPRQPLRGRVVLQLRDQGL
ncbi:MAG TPA: hypothetical protein VK504_27595, partial [Vicinamibacterales bacterium]|nr:hypothetical protein [Vicinamibacterales bacterium]